MHQCLVPSADNLALALRCNADVGAVRELVGNETEGANHGAAHNANRWVSTGITQPALLEGLLTRAGNSASKAAAAKGRNPVTTERSSVSGY